MKKTPKNRIKKKALPKKRVLHVCAKREAPIRIGFSTVPAVYVASVIDLRRIDDPARKKYQLAFWQGGERFQEFFSAHVLNVRKFLPRGRHLAKVLAIAVMISVATSPLFFAFEAHVINVTADIVQIDPPVLTPPGDIGLGNTAGGSNLSGTVDVVMTDVDPDATHIYYTYGSGLDPLSIPTPVCGETGPNGGGDIKTELIQLSLTSDTVIKAIACDGSTAGAHRSDINTKIYDFNDFACTPQIVSFPANLAVLAAGPGNSSSGDIFISSNTTINGDARSNDDINANGSGTSRFINGNATAGDNVEVANFTISGTVTEGAALTTLPDINIPFWEDKANDGGTVNGSLIIPGGVGTALNPLDLGPSEIMGNVSIDTNNVIEIHGPLYIHGNLSISSNVTINQDPAFGDQFVAIIVDGTIDINSNVAFNGVGTLGAFLLVSTAGPQAGDNAAIETNSNNSDLGDVVLYASNGDAHINSNRTLLAIFAKDGTSSSNPAIDLDSNVTVNYRTLPTTISCGPTFTPIDQVLINEFLPNPADTSGDTGFISPTATGGNHNQWSNAANAFSSNNLYATETTEDEDQSYENFGFSIPSGSTIDGIEVTTEGFSSNSSGCQIEPALWSTSDDEHSNRREQEVTGSDATYTLGSPTDLWGSTWIPSDFSNGNFHAEVQYDDTSGSSCSGNFSLDHLRVKVYYSVPGDLGAAGGPLDGEFVELYNGSGSSVDVNGYVLYDDFVPAGAAASKTWTSTADFTPGTTSNTTVSSNSVQLTSGQTSGTFEMVFDVGEGNRGDWQNLTWGESLTSSGDICIDVATSNDGISYTAFSSQDCGSPFSLSGIPDSRFIKWRSTHTRSNTSHTATLNDLTITYNLFDYHELVITSAKTNTGLTLIPSGGLLVVYREGDSDFELDNDGTDTVKLYNNHVWLGGTLVDSRTYDYGGAVPENKSFTRMPDGTANWVDPEPTPGEPNEEFINPDITPTEPMVFESEPLAEGEIEELMIDSPEESTENVADAGGNEIASSTPEGFVLGEVAPGDASSTSETASSTSETAVASSTDPIADVTPASAPEPVSEPEPAIEPDSPPEPEAPPAPEPEPPTPAPTPEPDTAPAPAPVTEPAPAE